VIELAKSLNLSRPDILEVGCANGCLSVRLSQLGQVTAIDLAEEAIAGAKARHPDIDFIAGEFLNVALPVGHFDLVVSVDVICHFENQQSFVDKVESLLKPRGYLVLMCPHRFIWDRTDFVRRSHGEIPLNWLNMSDLEGLLRDRFSVMHTETILPAGNRGLLRLINSYRLNALIQRVVPQSRIMRLKEQMGLGKTLVAVAQKRP
jgi:SAM-dependent methyltransferase